MARALLLAALAAAGLAEPAVEDHVSSTSRPLAAWVPKPAPSPAPPALDGLLGPGALPRRIHMYTIPAHGHYMTLRDVGVALARRGHNVTFVMCERNRKVFEDDGLPGLGVGFLSAGRCPIYDEYDSAIGELIANETPETVGRMLKGVITLSWQMCAAVVPAYEAAVAGGEALPDVIVFDADTTCAMDISTRYRIPRVARVGTGPRDSYQTPVSVAAYGAALPASMTTLQRLGNAALLGLSRYIMSGLIMPRLQAQSRLWWATCSASSSASSTRACADWAAYEAFVAAEEAVGAYGPWNALAAALKPSALGAVLARRSACASVWEDPAWPLVPLATGEGSTSLIPPEACYRYDMPWDGMPVLYNSHWGLDHARPLSPNEAMVGHTTAFEKEASKPLPGYLLAWLRAAPQLPVVYIGLGTMATLPGPTLQALIAAVRASTSYRFVWSVPPPQHRLLPHEVVDASRAWWEEADNATVTGGDLLIVPWAPQLALLMDQQVHVFLTHGGMNGVGEGTYAHTPMLCMPLFSDQPDNCRHMQDHGFGRVLARKELEEAHAAHGAAGAGALLQAHLDALTKSPGPAAAIHTAWQRNVAAGGIPRVVAIVEATADLGWGGTSHAVPGTYYLPFVQRHNLDVAAAAALLVTALVASCKCCVACTRRARRACCGKKPVASSKKTQ